MGAFIAEVAPTAPQAPSKAPASSGQFANVRKFIEANKGAGANIANKATSNIRQNVEQAKGNVQQVSALGSNVQQEEQRLAGSGQVREGIKANPLTLTDDETRFQQARQLITGQTAAQEQQKMLQERAQQAAQSLQGAQQQVQNLGTEAGRFGLLRKAVGGPSYSQGQQRLDQLLFQTEGAKQIGQTQKQLGSTLAQQVAEKQAQQEALGKRIQDYQTQAGTIATDLSNLLGEESTEFNKQREIERQQKQDLLAQQSGYLNQLFSGNLAEDNAEANKFADEALKAANLSRDMRTFNVLNDSSKLGGYIDNFNKQLGVQDVINREEAARINALSKLSGRDPSSFVTGVDSDDYRVNVNQKLGADIKTAQENFDKYIQDLGLMRIAASRDLDQGSRQFLNQQARDMFLGGRLGVIGRDIAGGLAGAQRGGTLLAEVSTAEANAQDLLDMYNRVTTGNAAAGNRYREDLTTGPNQGLVRTRSSGITGNVSEGGRMTTEDEIMRVLQGAGTAQDRFVGYNAGAGQSGAIGGSYIDESGAVRGSGAWFSDLATQQLLADFLEGLKGQGYDSRLDKKDRKVRDMEVNKVAGFSGSGGGISNLDRFVAPSERYVRTYKR